MKGKCVCNNVVKVSIIFTSKSIVLNKIVIGKRH